MLLYAMLYLSEVRGVDPEYERISEFAVTLDDIKNFRQLDSRTPGHPEYRWTAGVETTTGPLGQGCGNSVGMAIAGKWLAAISTSRALMFSITTCTPSAAMAT